MEKRRAEKLKQLVPFSLYNCDVVFRKGNKPFIFDERHLRMHIRQLEDTKTYRPQVFNSLPARANILSYLYHTNNDVVKAKAQNNEILEKHPNNVNALASKVHLCISDKNYKEANAVLGHIEKMFKEDRAKENLVVQAEVGYFYSILCPHLYGSSIKLYRAALGLGGSLSDNITQDMLSTTTQFLDDKHKMLLKLDLAIVYNKLLNNGNLGLPQNLQFPVQEDTHIALFTFLFLLFESVLSDAKRLLDENINQNIDEEYKAVISRTEAQAWAELGLTYKKYEVQVKETRRSYKLPRGMTFRNCFEKANFICPTDVTVKLRYGTYHRQLATCKRELMNAVKILDEALSICPSTHAALHQKAIALKYSWYIAKKKQEAKIVTEPARKKQKTVPPKPAHNTKRTKPAYFDILKVNNPTCFDPNDPPKALLEAKNSMEEAVNITNECRSQYLIELGRIWICLKQHDKAHDCFRKAEYEGNYTNPSDKGYLYEQWALLKQGQSEVDIEATKVLYRQAVEHTVAARTRSKVAYYNLRDLLIKQQLEAQTEENWKHLRLELGILEKTFQQLERAQQTFFDLLKREPTCLQTMWELVKVFYARREFTSAFSYIHIINTHMVEIDEEHFTDEEKNTIFNVGIGKGEVELSKNERDKAKLTYSSLFKMLMPQRYPSSDDLSDVGDDDDSTLGLTKSDILLLASEGGSDKVALLKEVLREQCGISLMVIATDDNDDLEPNMDPMNVLEMVLPSTKALIVVTDGLEADKKLCRYVSNILASLDQESDTTESIRLCGVQTKGKTQNLPLMLKKVPMIEIPDDTKEKHEYNQLLISNIFENILLQQADTE